MARRRKRGRDRGNDNNAGGSVERLRSRDNRDQNQSAGHSNRAAFHNNHHREVDFRNNKDHRTFNHSQRGWGGDRGNSHGAGRHRGRRGRGGGSGPHYKHGNSCQPHAIPQGHFGPLQGYHGGIGPSDTESDASSYYGDDGHPGGGDNGQGTTPTDPFAPFVQALQQNLRPRPCLKCRNIKKTNLQYRNVEAQRIQDQIVAFLAWADGVGVPFVCDIDEMDWQPEPLTLFTPGGEGRIPPGNAPQAAFGHTAGYLGGGAGDYERAANPGHGDWRWSQWRSGLTVEPGEGFGSSGFRSAMSVEVPRDTASGWSLGTNEFRYTPGADPHGNLDLGRWRPRDHADDGSGIF